MKESNSGGHLSLILELQGHPADKTLFRRDCLHGIKAGQLECSGPQVESKRCNRRACSNDAAITQIPQVTEFWTTEIPNFA